MSARTSIVKALVEKLKLIDGSTGYNLDISGNAFATLKFWDEVLDFPAVYASPGPETREYLPADFTWGYFTISLKAYVKNEDPQQQLEYLLEDIETVINANRVLVYNTTTNARTTEILITSIVTDEGLLVPYGVGEINLQVRYQVL